MKRMIKYLLVVFALLLGVFGNQSQIYAAGEKVFFGSESYEWSLGQESLIGVYAGADEGLNGVEMQVRYNSQMLEYVSGGEPAEAGVVNIRVTDTAVQEYREMFTFLPRVSGHTAEISEAVKVPVTIPFAAGCELASLSVGGQGVEGFQPSVTNYDLEIPPQQAEVQTTAAAPQTNVEITETQTTDELSTVQVVTTNAAGQQGLYTLQIRKTPAPQENTEPEVQTESPQEETETPPQETKQGNSLHEILFAVRAFATVLLLLLIAFISIKKRKRRELKKRLENHRREQRETLSVSEEDLIGVREEIPVVDDRDVEIQVKHVTMEFTKEKDESSSVKELLVRTIKGQRKVSKFKALDDVSFQIKKGEVVGLIGTNGSGKSTILKIISGVLTPTEGEVLVDKNKIQLLTLGTGFDFELTGKENVYLNGAVIGYTKEFIDEKYDEIVKFAELEGFMEEKVKNYSSGMVSRLGFAIATVQDTPEILILDEVLSVGDMFFRKKSEKRIREMMQSGSTVLIVSHSPSVIKANCTKAVWIEKGKLKAIGRPEDVCRAYEKMNG